MQDEFKLISNLVTCVEALSAGKCVVLYVQPSHGTLPQSLPLRLACIGISLFGLSPLFAVRMAEAHIMMQTLRDLEKQPYTVTMWRRLFTTPYKAKTALPMTWSPTANCMSALAELVDPSQKATPPYLFRVMRHDGLDNTSDQDTIQRAFQERSSQNSVYSAIAAAVAKGSKARSPFLHFCASLAGATSWARQGLANAKRKPIIVRLSTEFVDPRSSWTLAGSWTCEMRSCGTRSVLPLDGKELKLRSITRGARRSSSSWGVPTRICTSPWLFMTKQLVR